MKGFRNEGRKKPLAQWFGAEVVRLGLRALARVLPAPIVYSRATDDPYLSRWILIGSGKGGARGLFPGSRVKVCLHRIHRSDDARELHSHPWRFAVSLILAGGYREERLVRGVSPAAPPLQIGGRNFMRLHASDDVETFEYRAGSVNVIGGDDFHRLEVLEDDAWSLFVAVDDCKPWAFWNRDTGEVQDSRYFFAGQAAADKGAA